MLLGRGTVLPSRVPQNFLSFALKFRLGHQTANETCQHIAAAALRQIWIAGRIDEYFPFAAADQSLMAFQNDPAIAEPQR